ncbi:MAG: hypothetical protein JST10_10775 [Bacteroidetes bacterium]|nr:hypothetical protein [Bacteroidota bacterium]MBS1633042.1 hypothetical protein [Bacteroidota bacterium]
MKTNLRDFNSSNYFNLVYFDVFDPEAQPELWTKNLLVKMFSLLLAVGILVNYSSKGDVKSSLQAAEFRVEKIRFSS